MTLLKLPQLKDTYDTDIYGIDRVNGVLEIRGKVRTEGTPLAVPKPFQSMLMPRVAPQPQATSTPTVGAVSVSLSGMVNNERTIASAPRENSLLGQRKGIDVENLSNANSISRLSVDDPLHIEEMEYIEAQR